MTALAVLLLPNARRKLYFVQDWEPEFYPAGSTSAMVEATYRFGFHGICGSPVLAESYRAFGGAAEYINYAVDADLYHSQRAARPAGHVPRVFCYGRPGVPRNCFELLRAAALDIKAKLSDQVDIVTAGGEWDLAAYGLEGAVRNLGMIKFADLADFYRSADVALCLTASRNPSVMMLELMACGTPLVTVRNRFASWFLGGEGTALQCEPTRAEISNAVLAILGDAEASSARVAAGHRRISEMFSDWSMAYQTFARAVE